MKILLSKILLTIILVFGLLITGCPDSEDPGPKPGPSEFTVSFDLDYTGAPAVAAITVGSGAAAGGKWPADPVRLDLLGYTFGGWFDGAEEYTADTAINKTVTVKAQWSAEVSKLEDQPDPAALPALFATLPSNLSNSWKIWGHRNALITQGFSADPTTMIYNDRVYLFASNDSLEYDDSGNPKARTFADGIQGLRAISSADLSNWTDHGVINVGGVPPSTNPLIPDTPKVTPYETRSWAPSATWKRIGGRDRFFVYFANSGNGIGVIMSDSPTGPWRSPLPKLLIDRETPNCALVDYLFDPGVFIDDDGQAYLYFGGGQNFSNPNVPNNSNYTKYARRVRLNGDMISLSEIPEDWYVPYLFEACDMVKFNGAYYFTYCTNWSTGGFGLSNSQIAYMKGSDPMGIFKMNPDDPNTGSFSAPSRLLNTATGQLASRDDNNHQTMFVFKDNLYIAYHAAKVAEAMLAGDFKHRSTFIDKVTVNDDGTLQPVTMTRKGVDQVGNLNPYVPNEAETIGIMGGIYTRADADAGNKMVVTSIDTGDWVALYGVDFGTAGAKKFIARVRTPETPADYAGAIEIRLDPTGAGVTSDTGNLTTTNTARITGGTVVGRVYIKAKPGEEGKYTTVTAELDAPVTGVHDLVFVFYSSLGVRPETITRDSPHKRAFEFDQWQFLAE
jgi:arabinoxylan arabinofuranohydrolase